MSLCARKNTIKHIYDAFTDSYIPIGNKNLNRCRNSKYFRIYTVLRIQLFALYYIFYCLNVVKFFGVPYNYDATSRFVPVMRNRGPLVYICTGIPKHELAWTNAIIEYRNFVICLFVSRIRKRVCGRPSSTSINDISCQKMHYYSPHQCCSGVNCN